MRTASALVLLAAAAAAQSPPVAAIRNARIVPVSGPVLERGTIVVRNGLIADIGTNAAVPADAWVIEGEGLTVYPGLMDALGSLGIPDMAPGALPARPVTPPPPPPTAASASRGPENRPLTSSWVRAADLVRTTERRLEAARAAGYTSAVTFPSSGIFTGQGAVINLAAEDAGRMVVANGVGQFVTMARGAFSTFPGSLMGTIAYLRQVFLDADHYRRAKELYAKSPQGLERPAYDRALEGILDSPRVLIPAVSAVEIERMLRFAKELNLKAVLYGAHEGYAAASLLQQAKLPVLVSMKWPAPPPDRDPDEPETMRTLELRENAPSTPAALAKAGVPFALYVDGAPGDLTKAVRRAIEKGLAPADALRALTLSVAEIYGVADRVGSLEKGKIANLVVAKGDLFAEKPEVKYVFIDGVRYEPAPAAAPAKPEVTQ